MSGPMLQMLKDKRVFDVDAVHDGMFQITEGCDGYFTVFLTEQELRQLGQELIAMADRQAT